jgi:hypothetical protein
MMMMYVVVIATIIVVDDCFKDPKPDCDDETKKCTIV